MLVGARAVLIGMLVMLAGTLPRNALFVLNLRLHPEVPWAVGAAAVYLLLFWLYLNGAGPPKTTAAARRALLRANAIPLRQWAMALLAGGLGIVALVIGLKLANRMVVLPQQTLPDLSHIPRLTVVSLLLMAAPIAGVVEEAAFRGYMQGPLERQWGVVAAILVTGTMFAVAHLDFTPVLWPYYVAVAAIYGMVTYLTNSILPAIVLHTAGNLYSNFDLLLHGHAEWQASASDTLIWTAGADGTFWMESGGFAVLTALAVAAYLRLARMTRAARRVAAA